jgi:cytochrome c
MKLLPSVLTAIALTAVCAAPAMANLELAQKKACLACHQMDNKVVGPAYKDVAKKYKGQKGIEAKLVEKVLKGGKGSWGEVPMPANAQVNEAEAKQLVAWILSLK